MALLQRSRLAAPMLGRCRPGFSAATVSALRGYNTAAAANAAARGSRLVSSSSSHLTTTVGDRQNPAPSTAIYQPSQRFMSRPYSTASPDMYTASFAFFEAIWEAGITHCFVNLGSDHPSIIEAMVKGQREAKGKFPRIITCPNEVRLPKHLSVVHQGD